MNANDWSSVDGGSKTRGLVTTRTKPDRTRTETANGSGPVARRVTPCRILGMFGNGVLDVGIYQDIYIGKQHPRSPTPVPEPHLVILCFEPPSAPVGDRPPGRAWTPRTVTNRNGGGSDGSRRFRASSNVLAIRGADADAAGFGCATHLLCELVVKGDGSSHDALAYHIFITA